MKTTQLLSSAYRSSHWPSIPVTRDVSWCVYTNIPRRISVMQSVARKWSSDPFYFCWRERTGSPCEDSTQEIGTYQKPLLPSAWSTSEYGDEANSHPPLHCIPCDGVWMVSAALHGGIFYWKPCPLCHTPLQAAAAKTFFEQLYGLSPYQPGYLLFL